MLPVGPKVSYFAENETLNVSTIPTPMLSKLILLTHFEVSVKAWDHEVVLQSKAELDVVVKYWKKLEEFLNKPSDFKVRDLDENLRTRFNDPFFTKNYFEYWFSDYLTKCSKLAYFLYSEDKIQTPEVLKDFIKAVILRSKIISLFYNVIVIDFQDSEIQKLKSLLYEYKSIPIILVLKQAEYLVLECLSEAKPQSSQQTEKLLQLGSELLADFTDIDSRSNLEHVLYGLTKLLSGEGFTKAKSL